MSHFGTDLKRTSHTPSEWLKAGAQVGELVNRWSNRGDLVAYIGPEAGRGQAAALFDPAVAEVEVNTKAAFGESKPSDIEDLNERSTQFEYPKAAGAIFHEAMHAKFTTWDLYAAAKELEDNENAALHILEESRIEKYGIKAMPENRPLLRSCVMDIVLGDMTDERVASLSMTRQAAHTAALTLARIDAGVLEHEDVEKSTKLVTETLGEDLLGKLRAIWLEFQSISDPTRGIERMYNLARRWAKLVEDAADAKGEPKPQKGQPGSGGEGGEGGQGGLSEAEKEMIKEMMKALGGEAEGTAIAAGEEVMDQQTTERWEEQAKARGKDAKEKKDHQDTADQIFGNDRSGPLSGYSRSHLVETRAPTSEERVAAVRIGRALNKARYRDRVKSVQSNIAPPGRLRSRAMVQGMAQKSKGMHTQAEPWRRVQHKRVDDPNLTIGVMVDISGSMGHAMQPMAATAWILSEAVHRIQGKAAMVYFGDSVFPTLKPGQRLDKVNVYSASDGSEDFNTGFKALDGKLNLLNSTGARLLVVVSDGQYGGAGQADHTVKWLKRCARAGVAVLWIGYGRTGNVWGSGRGAAHYCAVTEAVLIEPDGRNTASDADKIGKAAADALTRAGQKRG